MKSLTPSNSPLSGGEHLAQHPNGSSPDKGRLGGVRSLRSPFIPYLPKLKVYARNNRKNPTAAEQKIWKILQREQFGGLKFTRQKPLDKFIVDFYCAQLLLAIEIDGDSHAEQEEYDDVRSDILKEKYGVEVVRYTNAEVLRNMEGVYGDLLERVSLRKARDEYQKFEVFTHEEVFEDV